jgi:Uma2 family endonuclease
MPREISLPEAKPAFEWVNGRALQKVSPKRKHSIAQTRFASALDAWARAGGRGLVGTEWRFRVKPPGEERRPLVPDVAFLSYASLSFEEQQVTDEPAIAPDAVVEVLSPGDRHSDVEEKIRVYLAAGSRVIFLVDTERQTVRVCDARGERIVSADQMLGHEAVPGFSLEVSELFSIPKPK